MPIAPSRPCPKPRCPNLQPCAQHARKAWDRVKRMPGGNGWNWQRIRKRILERDHYACRWCGAPATQVDHITPIARGGSDADTNLVASCARCNETRRRIQARQGRAS